MNKILLLIFFLPAGASASSVHAVQIAFGQTCLQVDGTPIVAGTAEYTTCCDPTENVLITSQASNPICQGLSSTSGDAQNNGGTNLALANQVMQQINNMSGADTNGPGGKVVGPATGSQQMPISSGLTAGGPSGAGDTGAGNPNTGFGGTAAGSGGGGSNGGGVGSATSAAPTGKKIASLGGGPDSAGIYVGVPHPDGAAPPSAAVNPGDTGELKFGANGNGGANGDGSGAGANGDGEDVGSSIDPDDYFNRIKAGDNIFMIVSKKYKQKSPKMAQIEAPKK